VNEPQDTVTLTDGEIETKRFDTATRAWTADTGDDSGDDSTDTGDDSGDDSTDTGDDSGDISDVSDTGDDSGDTGDDS
jgi:hypothetical protein